MDLQQTPPTPPMRPEDEESKSSEQGSMQSQIVTPTPSSEDTASTSDSHDTPDATSSEETASAPAVENDMPSPVSDSSSSESDDVSVPVSHEPEMETETTPVAFTSQPESSFDSIKPSDSAEPAVESTTPALAQPANVPESVSFGSDAPSATTMPDFSAQNSMGPQTSATPTTPLPPMPQLDGQLPSEMSTPVVSPGIGGRLRSRKTKLMLLIAAAIIVVGGASAAAYVGYYMPNQPKYLLARAIGNTLSTDKVKTAHLDGDFSLKDTTQGGQSYSGTLTGEAGGTGFDLSTTLDLSVTKVNAEILTTDGKTAYLKISGLDGLPELLQGMGDSTASMYAPIIKSVNGQWLEIDQQLLSNLGQSNPLSTGNTRLSDADAKKLENIYRNHLFFDVAKTYSDQTINGMPSHHYQVKINKQQLHDFLADLKAANIKSIDVTSDNIASLDKSNIDKYPMDVWIAKSGTFIDQLSFTTGGSQSVQFRLALGDVNKPVTITKPTTSKTLLQVLGTSDLMSGMSMSGSDSMDMSTGLTTSAPMNFTAQVQ